MAGSTSDLALPIIDLSGYLNPTGPEDKARVVAEVRAACARFGFFQVKGHGVPLASQQALVKSLYTFFAQDKAEKMKMSFLENPGRRGYEQAGDTARNSDKLPDTKEAFYIGREDPAFEPPGFHCPNQWPNLPDHEFRTPVMKYYEETDKLGRTIWEILLEGLGHSTKLLDKFAKRPIVQMKMIRYPESHSTLPGQFGNGAHTDFGGVTVLLQEPGREGLEVWEDSKQDWLPVPSLEDVLVINCGNMISRWSGGAYKSALHRVTNVRDTPRVSCATFWHGDANASNPLNPNDTNKDTVGKLCLDRFRGQFSLPDSVQVAEAQAPAIAA